MLDFQSFDIISLRKAYEGSVTPKDVINEVYRRIDEASDPGIFIHLIEKEDVFISAAKLNNCDLNIKPLWGIPFVIKDNIDAAGILTTAGCLEFAYMPEENAVVVAQLLEAGALLIGKTNLDQFATGLVGMRTPFPVPKNALDPEIVPGGSSSGSAVAVARGLVSFSLGTDTAGSGRVPAALNGIVGLKPTLGILSNTGVVPACRTLDTISRFATNVVDAQEVLHGHSPSSSVQRTMTVDACGTTEYMAPECFASRSDRGLATQKGGDGAGDELAARRRVSLLFLCSFFLSFVNHILEPPQIDPNRILKRKYQTSSKTLPKWIPGELKNNIFQDSWNSSFRCPSRL